MDTLGLPPHPDLAHYRKRAKDLVKAARSADDGAVRAWSTEWLQALARLRGVTVTPFVQASFDRAIEHIEERVREKAAAAHAARGKFTLADAQFLIAGAHGFENWSDFARHLEQMSRESRTNPRDREFETAADAVVAGDLPALESLLRRDPQLVRARSARKHRATLLHYVAANGVEDFRQRTPPNAVDVARLLLGGGAEVDALANTYGGDKAQTTMNLLVSSAHPAEAGLQAPLVEVLLDFGAAINGPEDDASPLLTALSFGYPEPARVLARRGARIDNIPAAAALGRLDLVKRYVKDGGAPIRLHWMRVPSDAKGRVALALVWACEFGQAEVAQFLLEAGVDPAAADANRMTGLHHAAARGRVEIVKLLLRHGAPLEAVNQWGGTVLDSTVYSALQGPWPGVNYPEMISILIAAGANVGAVTPFPTGNREIDALLRRVD